MLGIGGMIVFHAVVSSVFGDGHQDVRRHGIALLPGVSFVAAGFVIVLVRGFHGASADSKAAESGSFWKNRTRLLRVWAEPTRRSRSQSNQKFLASFFQERRPSFLA
jgi:hypothetical protein